MALKTGSTVQVRQVTPGDKQNWLLKTGDPLIQVQLHCNLVLGTPERWLLKAGEPLLQWPLKTGSTVHIKLFSKKRQVAFIRAGASVRIFIVYFCCC